MEMDFRSSIPEVFSEFLDGDLERHGNKKCCDCDGDNPDWCSLGFGTFICLDCAGRHRSLGVHITLVKSLVLDVWEEKQYQYIRLGGNKRFLSHLESIKMPNGEKYYFVNTTEKYKHPEVIYYKEILEAEVEGREPRSRNDDYVIGLTENAQHGSAKSSPVSPKWVPNSETPTCMICNIHFTIFRRKHHCRRCGQIVCNECAPSKNTRPIPEWNFKEPVRHCKNCFKSPALPW